jgi:hypothetical protein
LDSSNLSNSLNKRLSHRHLEWALDNNNSRNSLLVRQQEQGVCLDRQILLRRNPCPDSVPLSRSSSNPRV